ncbi:MAG: TIGR04283 family arsenosugar biosynthesis glycosyltransferase [Leptolyngbyaceae cyanobacterium bins.59]|nr:TIGR04283 family arsenosugar biosynthesis glycosyltransferase [Leptolyngbyaceae cyanobacterium bins.59]
MISIIIPTLNEAQEIVQTLEIAQRSFATEVIVVDGGSQDGTVQLAESKGAIVLKTNPGRAHQMNQGAALATGEILLFLHGDTRLPPGFDHQIREFLSHQDIIAGAFTLKIADSLPGLRWVERVVNWRSRVLQFPYGDQALFLLRKTFECMGPFPEMPIMEDFELVRRLRQQGKIGIVPSPVITSGRRWRKLGIVKTTLINQAMILGYLTGVSPERLATWYRRK